MYFSQNIRLLRKRRKRTQDDVAHALNMKRSTLSGYENQIAEPNLSALMAFSKYFGVAIDTLVKVELEKLSESQLSQLEKGRNVYVTGSKLRVLATTVDRDNDENIELVPEKAKAGYSRGFADPEFVRRLPVFRLPFLSGNRKYRTFHLNGDSMLPIPDKSWVTGEFVQNWHDIISGEAYIILTLDEGIVFKIVDNLLRKEHKLVLYSLNPVYEPYDVHANQIKEIWKFVHYISSEIPEPVIPREELFRTVAGLKHDVDVLKKRVLRRTEL